MTSDLILSVQITLLGMGLVFGAIILLWGAMSVLTTLAADKQPPEEEPDGASRAPAAAPPPQADAKLQAALIAAALALAEEKQTRTQPPVVSVSAWQLQTRARQMTEKRHHKRH